MKLKVTVQVNNENHEMLFDRNNHTTIPDNDFLLREFSAHYQFKGRRKMPSTASIVSVEQLDA